MTIAYKVKMTNGMTRIVLNDTELKEMQKANIVLNVKEIKNGYLVNNF